MRRTASEVLNTLEMRVARLEKESYGYKVETEEGYDFSIPRDYRKNKMKATSLFDRLLGRTFNNQIEKALESEGAGNISVNFEPSSRVVGTRMNPYAKAEPDQPSLFDLTAEGEGKMFFMLEGKPYEFPFILVDDRIYLGFKENRDVAGSVQTTDDGEVSKVVMGRNFRNAIERANGKFYGKRFASRSKYARSIPKPPRYRGLVDLKRAISISDRALDQEYGYGLSKPNTFGYEANKYSSLYALNAIQENIDLVIANPDDVELIEIVSDAVHDGWSWAAYNVDDPRYLTQPEKKITRMVDADASYRSLSEDVKEKDRVIARALIYTYYMASKR